jgi:hypothetical protein
MVVTLPSTSELVSTIALDVVELDPAAHRRAAEGSFDAVDAQATAHAVDLDVENRRDPHFDVDVRFFLRAPLRELRFDEDTTVPLIDGHLDDVVIMA